MEMMPSYEAVDRKVAMTAGMLPIALGLGADSSFRQRMAVAAIDGLLISTAPSLLIEPVVFTYVVEGFVRRLAALRGGTPILNQ